MKVLKNIFPLLLLIAAVDGARAYAYEVQYVNQNEQIAIVSRDKRYISSEFPKICIIRAGKEITCGKVVDTTYSGYVVKFSPLTAAIYEGDTAIPYFDWAPVVSKYWRSVTLGYFAGGPSFSLQNRIAGGWTVGMTAAHLTEMGGSVKYQSEEILASSSYFFFRELSGPWVSGLLGFDFTGISGLPVPLASNHPVAGMATGWTLIFDPGFTAGLGLGVKLRFPPDTISMQKTSWFVKAEIGWTF